MGCTQRECKSKKSIIEEDKMMFESRISAGETVKFLVGKIERENSRLVLRCGGSCEEMRGTILRIGDKTIQQLYKGATPHHHFTKEELETVMDFP